MKTVIRLEINTVCRDYFSAKIKPPKELNLMLIGHENYLKKINVVFILKILSIVVKMILHTRYGRSIISSAIFSDLSKPQTERIF